jgi:transposase
MKKTKESKGKVSRCLPDSRQLDLVPGVIAAPSNSPAVAGEWDFVNPSPELLYIGNVRLDAYLSHSGLGYVLKLREYIFSSDLTPFLSGYSSLGRRAIHPGILLSLILYGIMEGKWSLRSLEEMAVKDSCAWWLCGGVQPDHSTIGKFLNHFGDILTEDYFVSLSQRLVEHLHLSGGMVAGDGTVIEAVSSRYRAIKQEAAAQAAAEAHADLERHPEDAQAQQRAAQAEAAHQTLLSRQARSCRRRNSKGPDKLRVCPHEPEAVLQPLKNGSYRPSYKPVILSSPERMVVGHFVHGSEESAGVGAMLAQHRSLYGSLPLRALFDSGFHNHKVLGLCVAMDLDVLCPSGSASQGEWEKRDSKYFSKERFRYDEARDVYLCPGGKQLKRYQNRRQDGVAYVLYRCRECEGCPLRDRCTRCPSGRTINRYPGDDLKENMSRVLEQESARRIYSKRSGMVEPVFAELKRDQNLNRFHRRGLAGARLEFSLHCTAYNLKRAIRIEKARALCLILFWFKGQRLLWTAALVVKLDPRPF